jgi:hypothetical protein
MSYWKKLAVGIALLVASPVAVPLVASAATALYLLLAGAFVVGAVKVTWTK